MSDNLREAVANFADVLDERASTASYAGTEREMDGLLTAATELRAILAAHPDETGTEPVGGLDELARHWRKDAS